MNDSLGTESVKILAEFNKFFKPYFIPIAYTICIFGIISNLINLTVLIHRSMRTPTNILLAVLAVSDLLQMVIYIPFNVINQLGLVAGSDYWLALYLYFSVNLTLCLHLVSTGVILSLAVFRIIYIKLPVKKNNLCSFRKVRLSVVLVVISSMLLILPSIIIHQIDQNQNGTFKISINEKHQRFLLIFYAVTSKLIPSTVLLIFFLMIMYLIRKNNQNSKNLRKQNILGNTRSLSNIDINKDSVNQREKSGSRTTKILLIIMILFIIAYLPHGITLVSNNKNIMEEIYNNLGDFFDLLQLLNNAINFILYCSMSRQFQTAFISLLFNRKFSKVLEPKASTIFVNEKAKISKCLNDRPCETDI